MGCRRLLWLYYTQKLPAEHAETAGGLDATSPIPVAALLAAPFTPIPSTPLRTGLTFPIKGEGIPPNPLATLRMLTLYRCR